MCMKPKDSGVQDPYPLLFKLQVTGVGKQRPKTQRIDIEREARRTSRGMEPLTHISAKRTGKILHRYERQEITDGEKISPNAGMQLLSSSGER